MTMSASVLAMHDTGKLFEPDAILPAQFYAMFKNSQYREPERRLMVAILEDAVSCLSMNVRQCSLRQQKQYEEAKHWVTAEEESEWIFSFRSICEVLGMDPSYLRRGLIRQPTNSRTHNISAIVTTPGRRGNLRGATQRKKIRIRTTS